MKEKTFKTHPPKSYIEWESRFDKNNPEWIEDISILKISSKVSVDVNIAIAQLYKGWRLVTK